MIDTDIDNWYKKKWMIKTKLLYVIFSNFLFTVKLEKRFWYSFMW